MVTKFKTTPTFTLIFTSVLSVKILFSEQLSPPQIRGVNVSHLANRISLSLHFLQLTFVGLNVKLSFVDFYLSVINGLKLAQIKNKHLTSLKIIDSLRFSSLRRRNLTLDI